MSPSEGEDDSLELSAVERIDAVCRRFEAAWKAGEQPRLEDFLAEVQGPEQDALRSELLKLECHYRSRATQTWTLEHRPAEGESGGGPAPGPAAPGGAADEVPSRIGRYPVHRRIDGGGQADVYLGTHPTLGRPIVIKWLKAELAAQAGHGERLAREGRLLTALDHPHAVRVHDLDVHQGRPFLVMEHIDGRTLLRYAQEEHPAPERAAALVAVLARAVAAAHALGITHQDINPRNVLVDRQGRPRLIDFGLALCRPAWGEGDDPLNTAGGTYTYLSPEQARGEVEAIGSATDVFGLGAVLYFLLTGKPLYRGSSVPDVLAQARAAAYDLDALERPGVPRGLAEVCRQCLAADPARRPRAEALAALLDRYATPKRWKRLAWRWALLGTGLAAALLVVGLVVARKSQPGQQLSAADGPPAVKSFLLDCYRVEGGEGRPLGTVSGEVRGNALETVPFGTHVFTRVELTAPAHAFLIALNADGTAQLRWPVNDQRKPDEGVPPPRVERFQDPDPARVGPLGGPMTFILDDEPGGGLQGFALVLSSRPLPPYAEWKQGRELGAWRRLTGLSNPFVADVKGTYPVLRGRGVVRGSEGELGRGPDLRPLCRALGAGVDGVEVLAVPVEGRP